MSRPLVIALLLAVTGLAGCDMLGIENPEKVAALREAEGKAIGGGCRHSARAIEDCYAINRKADKAAVFAGWREMNDYMRENKIDPVVPQANALASANARPSAEDAAQAAVDDGKSTKPASERKAKSARKDS
jgi:hypothetical protein